MQHGALLNLAGIPDRRLMCATVQRVPGFFNTLSIAVIGVAIAVVFNAGVIAQSLSKDTYEVSKNQKTG